MRNRRSGTGEATEQSQHVAMGSTARACVCRHCSGKGRTRGLVPSGRDCQRRRDCDADEAEHVAGGERSEDVRRNARTKRVDERFCSTSRQGRRVVMRQSSIRNNGTFLGARRAPSMHHASLRSALAPPSRRMGSVVRGASF